LREDNLPMETQLSFTQDDLLTPDDVAAILRVGRLTALDYMRRGVIPACKIGRRWYSPKPLLDEFLTSLFSDEAGG
jgi:excisionase family DNA binding protein